MKGFHELAGSVM
jgi:hypothetical protein